MNQTQPLLPAVFRAYCRAVAPGTAIAILIFAICGCVRAQDTAPAQPGATPNQDAAQPTAPQSSNLHFQSTAVVQGDPGFSAKYSGKNSLYKRGEIDETINTDVFAGKRLWRGGELHADLLVWQGFGLSKTLGVEAFPSANAYKYGTWVPYAMMARLFIRQTYGLGGEKEDVDDDQLTLAGKQDVRRVTLTVGRFSPTDIMDNSAYAKDPESQFMNWGLVDNLTWDYAADAVGFAPGMTAELNQPKWALRYGVFLMPAVQNSFTGDDRFLMLPPNGAFGPILKDWAMSMEYERRYTSGSHSGAIRVMAFLNRAKMASFNTATQFLEQNGPNADFTSVRDFSYKHGFGISWDQEISKVAGLFSRLGWNDGNEEAWAYTDANWSVSLGASLKGDAWNHPGDTVGIAGICSGASTAQQRFLEAGGYGILDGDGALNYAPEDVLEAYYNHRVSKTLQVTPDFQFVANPAFNQDRGPVSIFGVRVHLAW